MKITTFEQLADAMERIDGKYIPIGAPIEVELADYLKKSEASDTYVTKAEFAEGGGGGLDSSTFLTKAEASDTYAVKINGVFRSEDEVAETFGHISYAPAGTVWIKNSGSKPYLYTVRDKTYWYIPFQQGGQTEEPNPIEDYDDPELDWFDPNNP